MPESAIAPFSGPPPPPASGGGVASLSCPIGKQCRLTVVKGNEQLVYCVLLEPGVCPNIASFGDTRFCRALMHSAPAKPLAWRRE